MQGRRGATLFEVTVTLALVAIGAGLVAPRAAALATSVRLAATTRTLAQAIRLVRGQAVAEGLPLDVRFQPAARTWTVMTAAGTVRAASTLEAPLGFTALPASGRIRFGPSGTAENATVTIGADGRQMSIVVNQRGRVRLQ